jgi:hypothetical protein
MNSDHDAALEHAIQVTFERMAFESATPREDGDFDVEAAGNYWASIDAISPTSGTLTLVVGKALAYRIGEAILGEFEVDDEETLLDALGEFMNALAGSWLSQIATADQPLELGFPKTGCSAWGNGRGPGTLRPYEIDGEGIVLVLERMTDQDGCEEPDDDRPE